MAPPTPRDATASSTAPAAGIGLGDDDKNGLLVRVSFSLLDSN
jgi:hypothetical protein